MLRNIKTISKTFLGIQFLCHQRNCSFSGIDFCRQPQNSEKQVNSQILPLNYFYVSTLCFKLNRNVL